VAVPSPSHQPDLAQHFRCRPAGLLPEALDSVEQGQSLARRQPAQLGHERLAIDAPLGVEGIVRDGLTFSPRLKPGDSR
jgi:hypothetical protein